MAALIGCLFTALLPFRLGFTKAGTLHRRWPSSPEDLWWPWSPLGAVVIALAGCFGVRAASGFGTVLGVFDLVVLSVFAIPLIGQEGFGQHASGVRHFAPCGRLRRHRRVLRRLRAHDAGLRPGSEAAAPLAGRTKDPRRMMRCAVLGAALTIGLVHLRAFARLHPRRRSAVIGVPRPGDGHARQGEARPAAWPWSAR